MKIKNFKIKIFADGAEKRSILELNKKSFIRGFTTNPSLMRKAGISDYEGFARDIVKAAPDHPFSFEVFADDFEDMKRQALLISRWGENIYVKIPITDTAGKSTGDVVRYLADRKVKLNITAITHIEQVKHIVPCLIQCPSAFVSVFAGRIADTGIDPVPVMTDAVHCLKPYPQIELIWASTRELLNIFQADSIGCHIITVTPEILNKLPIIGKPLDEYSLETVQSFFEDGRKAGFKL